MLELFSFIFLALVGFASAIVLLLQRNLFKAAIALAIVFVAVAGFIAVAGQTIIALFQLLILVGGLSTYLIVAVASEKESSFRHVDMRVVTIVFVLFGALIFYSVAANSHPASLGNAGILADITAAMKGYFAFMAAIAFLMFAIAIGSVLLIKRAVRVV